MTYQQFVETLDNWGKNRTPFFFLIDFEQQKPIAFPLNEMPKDVLFDFNSRTNFNKSPKNASSIQLRVKPIDENIFKKKFDVVSEALEYGDSYLINLTLRTEIDLDTTLEDLFSVVEAKYKLFYRNQFLVFSPEIFVKIEDGVVYSFPMKGTIDASIENAEEKILNDQKELAEHVTIVDLIRNDLSLIAEDVHVSRFRYIDLVRSNRKELLQVSSKIQGRLIREYDHAFGTILDKLLPAGSISGAPKKRTVEIIRQAEQIDRGYYTGVAGIFDGNVFDSGVLIRFIENANSRLYYRSGGGITTASDWKKEFREVIDKIYVPVNRNN
ncbi:MAG TPA: aminodeoxychorismate synthase component I [Chryseosolibacter sp.]